MLTPALEKMVCALSQGSLPDTPCRADFLAPNGFITLSVQRMVNLNIANRFALSAGEVYLRPRKGPSQVVHRPTFLSVPASGKDICT